MSRSCSIVLSVALLIAYYQAPHLHTHHNDASDHVMQHHQGNAWPDHTHPGNAPHRSAPFAGMGSLTGDEQDDALFLPWVVRVAHTSFLGIALPSEMENPIPADGFAYALSSPDLCGHNPPLVVSSAPRSPPV